MTNRNDEKTPVVQADWEALFEKAIKQPGVAEVLKLYDAAESVYSAANAQPQPTEFTTTSANAPLARKA